MSDMVERIAGTAGTPGTAETSAEGDATNVTLFIGNISITCTEKNIHEIFSEYGTVVVVRIQRCSKTGTSLGYGFLAMSCEEEAVQCLQHLHDKYLFGRYLKVRRAGYGLDADGNNCTSAPKSKSSELNFFNIESPTYTVHFKFHCSHPSCTISELMIRDIFEDCGPIRDVAIRKVSADKVSGLLCGYGFLHYLDDEDGLNAALAVLKTKAYLVICCSTEDHPTEYSLEASNNLQKHLAYMGIELPATPKPCNSLTGSGLASRPNPPVQQAHLAEHRGNHNRTDVRPKHHSKGRGFRGGGGRDPSPRLIANSFSPHNQFQRHPRGHPAAGQHHDSVFFQEVTPTPMPVPTQRYHQQNPRGMPQPVGYSDAGYVPNIYASAPTRQQYPRPNGLVHQNVPRNMMSAPGAAGCHTYGHMGPSPANVRVAYNRSTVTMDNNEFVSRLSHTMMRPGGDTPNLSYSAPAGAAGPNYFPSNISGPPGFELGGVSQHQYQRLNASINSVESNANIRPQANVTSGHSILMGRFHGALDGPNELTPDDYEYGPIGQSSGGSLNSFQMK